MTETVSQTLIPPGEIALHTIDAGEGITLLLPNSGIAENANLTRLQQFVVACALRSDDDFFVREMCAWLEEKMEQEQPVLNSQMEREK